MMETLFNIVSADYLHMIVRFLICLLTNWVVVDLLYYHKSHRRDFYFTFMLIGVAIFFIVFFMIFVRCHARERDDLSLCGDMSLGGQRPGIDHAPGGTGTHRPAHCVVRVDM